MDEFDELHSIKSWLPSDIIPNEADEGAEIGTVMLRLRRAAGDIEDAWDKLERAHLVITQQMQMLQESVNSMPKGSTDFTKAASALAKTGLKDLIAAWGELEASLLDSDRERCAAAIKLAAASQDKLSRLVEWIISYEAGTSFL